jgi:light-regulated signal transduction histidine kinase (bacteriophytochrome)
VEMRPERVDLSVAAEAVVAELLQREPDREVEFIAEPGLTAVVDRALAGILLQNLLDNAWKYTRRVSPARIRLARAPQAPGAGEGPVYLINDNGAGFDMRYVAKLFAPFQRLHGPREFEGTGIGLATAHRLPAQWARLDRGCGRTGDHGLLYFWRGAGVASGLRRRPVAPFSHAPQEDPARRGQP